MKYLSTIFLLLIIVTPLMIDAQGLIVCGQGGIVSTTTGQLADECTWVDLIQLINILIDFIVEITLVIGTIILMYTGFEYITAGGSEKKVKAKKRIIKLVKGLFLILASYLIVNTAFTLLGVDDEYNYLNDTHVEE